MKKLAQKVAIASVMTSTALLGAFSSAASAFDFTPQQQGEVNVGLGCLETCLTLDPIFASIESLVDDTTGTKSRLFVDYFGADDVEVSFGTGSNRVVLKTRDAGTNPAGYWFRPSEVESSSNEEQGQLEVGTYLFNFSRTIAELTIDFFDTESFPTTGVLQVNGVDLASPDYVVKGANENVVSQTFTNVDSLMIKLGQDAVQGTGDGVDFRVSGQPVPEPASLVGLAAIAVGSVALKKHRKMAA